MNPHLQIWPPIVRSLRFQTPHWWYFPVKGVHIYRFNGSLPHPSTAAFFLYRPRASLRAPLRTSLDSSVHRHFIMFDLIYPPLALSLCCTLSTPPCICDFHAPCAPSVPSCSPYLHTPAPHFMRPLTILSYCPPFATSPAPFRHPSSHHCPYTSAHTNSPTSHPPPPPRALRAAAYALVDWYYLPA